MKYLIALLLLSACGTPSAAPSCKVINLCTNSSVSGYQCTTDTWGSTTLSTHSACDTVYHDFQYTPGCTDSNPTDTCGGGWMGTYACCKTIAGPGPSN